MDMFMYSYGRKPKGERLRAVMLPPAIPECWNGVELADCFFVPAE